MSWTTPADIREQVARLWDRGLILAEIAGGESLFPRRLRFSGPKTRELGERFAEVREWISGLAAGAGEYRIVWRTVRHRQLGENRVPAEVWVDDVDAALALIGKRREAERFAGLVAETRAVLPGLVPWLCRRGLWALEHADEWPLLLAVAAWLRDHPRPGIYLRQLDLPGVHSKLIERRRKVLAELFDLVLPEEAIDPAHSGAAGFCRRYGFLDKPLRVRFRLLDPEIRLLGPARDLTLTAADFAALDPPVNTVFITENEINFLAFPDHPRSLVIFGAGYGFDHLAAAAWMQSKNLFYWGDIDTHGFAILDQLRGLFPQARSLLMDEATLLAHRGLWGREPRPQNAELERLTPAESRLYERLRQNYWAGNLRLEQERVGYGHLAAALRPLSR